MIVYGNCFIVFMLVVGYLVVVFKIFFSLWLKCIWVLVDVYYFKNFYDFFFLLDWFRIILFVFVDIVLCLIWVWLCLLIYFVLGIVMKFYLLWIFGVKIFNMLYVL